MQLSDAQSAEAASLVLLWLLHALHGRHAGQVEKQGLFKDNIY